MRCGAKIRRLIERSKRLTDRIHKETELDASRTSAGTYNILNEDIKKRMRIEETIYKTFVTHLIWPRTTQDGQQFVETDIKTGFPIRIRKGEDSRLNLSI